MWSDKQIERIDDATDEMYRDELVCRALRVWFTDGTSALLEASYYDGPCLHLGLVHR